MSPVVLYSLKVENGVFYPTWVTDNITSVLGYEAEDCLSPSWWSDHLYPDDREMVLSGLPSLFTKDCLIHEYRFQKKDGDFIWVLDELKLFRNESGMPMEIVGAWTDVTGRRQIEAEREKSNRLESVGILAGGIAHDFNNLLTAILGYISIVKMHMSNDNSDYRRLADAENSCIKATELTSRLITFSKGGEPVKRLVSISKVARETICSSLHGPDITCECDIPEHLYPVYADENQMLQVFRNLTLNAKEAMPEGGAVKVIAENGVLGKGSSNVLKEGRYVKITIRDSGRGINEETLPKIFDPYFSTKSIGSERGVGLGLAVCWSVIKKHDGHITVESSPGEGTAFHIYLPAAEAEIRIQASPSLQP